MKPKTLKMLQDAARRAPKDPDFKYDQSSWCGCVLGFARYEAGEDNVYAIWPPEYGEIDAGAATRVVTKALYSSHPLVAKLIPEITARGGLSGKGVAILEAMPMYRSAAILAAMRAPAASRALRSMTRRDRAVEIEKRANLIRANNL